VWYAYVLVVIYWPTDLPVPSKTAPEAWQALRHVAQLLEIVGPHESWGTDFASDLRYVRQYHRLLRDAPPLADAYRLPPPSLARELCSFNEAFQSYLRVQKLIYLYRAEELDVVLQETARLHEVWDAVRRAGSPGEPWALRRRMLQKLREILGDAAYYNRELPCWVPVWRFPADQGLVLKNDE
jgi:hypothetical protein